MPLATRSMETTGRVVALPARSPRPGKLDRIDLRILAQIQRDCRLSSNRLAEMVGLSATPCLRRVRRLEAQGYLRSFGGEINVDRLGGHVTAFAEIKLKSCSSAHTRPFEDFVHKHPQILECALVSDGFDYLLRVVAPDVGGLQKLMEEMVESCGAVYHFQVHVSLKSIKQSREFPLSIFEPAVRSAQ